MKAMASVVLICTCALSACSTFSRFTQTQGDVSKFDQGAQAIGSSEIAFLHQVQTAECTRNFYEQGYAFATAQQDPETHSYPNSPLDLAPPCTPQELTNDELQLREKLIGAITLYADSMQALTSGTNDSGLNSNSSSLAKNIQSLASQQKFTAVSANETAGLNAAVASIAEFIIDHREYTKIKDAASNLQQPLATIVDALKSENLNDAQGLASKSATVTNDFRIAVSSSRDRRGPASFLDIAEAHRALGSILVAAPDVVRLNSALDALLSANQALASPTNAGAKPELSALVSRGQQVVSLFSSSK
jgi:hypothetical protein